MFKKIKTLIAAFLVALKNTISQFQKQYAFELINVFTCKDARKQKLEIKITGKSTSLICYAQEVVNDEKFINGLSPSDIRTICYLAASEKYEAILEEKNCIKTFEVIRSNKINGDKSIKLKNKISGEIITIKLKDFADSNLIEKLENIDVYQLGYLAGQEQSYKDFIKLKLKSLQ